MKWKCLVGVDTSSSDGESGHTSLVWESENNTIAGTFSGGESVFGPIIAYSAKLSFQHFLSSSSEGLATNPPETILSMIQMAQSDIRDALLEELADQDCECVVEDDTVFFRVANEDSDWCPVACQLESGVLVAIVNDVLYCVRLDEGESCVVILAQQEKVEDLSDVLQRGGPFAVQSLDLSALQVNSHVAVLLSSAPLCCTDEEVRNALLQHLIPPHRTVSSLQTLSQQREPESISAVAVLRLVADQGGEQVQQGSTRAVRFRDTNDFHVSEEQYDDDDDVPPPPPAPPRSTASTAEEVSDRLLQYEQWRLSRVAQRRAQTHADAGLFRPTLHAPHSQKLLRRRAQRQAQAGDDESVATAGSASTSASSRLYALAQRQQQAQQQQADTLLAQGRLTQHDPLTGQRLFQPKLNAVSSLLADKQRQTLLDSVVDPESGSLYSIEQLLQQQGERYKARVQQRVAQQTAQRQQQAAASHLSAASAKLAEAADARHGLQSQSQQQRLQRPIGAVRDSTARSLPQHSFTPTINATSAQLAQQSGYLHNYIPTQPDTDSGFGEDPLYPYAEGGFGMYEEGEEHGGAQEVRPGSSYSLLPASYRRGGVQGGAQGGVDAVQQRSQRWAAQRAQRLQREQQAAQRRDLAQCSFRPQISQTPRTSQTQGGSGSGELVQRHMQWSAQREERLQAQRRRRADEELQGCTFAPQTLGASGERSLSAGRSRRQVPAPPLPPPVSEHSLAQMPNATSQTQSLGVGSEHRSVQIPSRTQNVGVTEESPGALLLRRHSQHLNKSKAASAAVRPVEQYEFTDPDSGRGPRPAHQMYELEDDEDLVSLAASAAGYSACSGSTMPRYTYAEPQSHAALPVAPPRAQPHTHTAAQRQQHHPPQGHTQHQEYHHHPQQQGHHHTQGYPHQGYHQQGYHHQQEPLYSDGLEDAVDPADLL